jgi:undecaprenyl diphosphate synthase
MHIAIIMDGNGRWAQLRQLARSSGHRAGAKAVDRIIETAARHGIETLTLFAFSSDNWQRPAEEVRGLMTLFRRYLFTQTRRCVDNSIRINVIGRRDRLDTSVCRAIERSEEATSKCSGMHLRIAVDYSSQQSLMTVGQSLPADSAIDRTEFLQALARVNHSVPTAPEVDLLIRTGGERRLSDFLLWECAYAELHFVDCLWPDFNEQEFQRALTDFARRERRFGRIQPVAAAGPT